LYSQVNVATRLRCDWKYSKDLVTHLSPSANSERILKIGQHLPSAIYNIWAMMIVQRIRTKIIRTVLCYIVYRSDVHNDVHTCEQFLLLV